MDVFHFLTMLGGLCLFLFGMSLMGQALERRAVTGGVQYLFRFRFGDTERLHSAHDRLDFLFEIRGGLIYRRVHLGGGFLGSAHAVVHVLSGAALPVITAVHLSYPAGGSGNRSAAP